MNNHTLYMRRAIDLASLAGPEVRSNPPVGCVIVYDDKVIGEGHTQAWGGPHAEVMAFDSVSDADHIHLKNAAIYVTLEPCSHFGKTSPCSDLLIKHQVKKVFISQIDPYEKVAGKGIEKLKKAGIEVEVGLMKKESDLLFRPFKKWIDKPVPYVTLKWAQSSDQYYGVQGEQVWLSNLHSKVYAHKLRSKHDAILVGTNTVLTDAPALDNRLWTGDSPTRIILDRNARIPIDHSIYKKDKELVVYSICDEPVDLQKDPKTVWRKLKLDDFSLENVLHDLGQLGYFRILVEGGASIQKSFIKKGLWDEAVVIRTPKKLLSGIRAPHLEGHLEKKMQLEEDEILHIRKLNLI